MKEGHSLRSRRAHLVCCSCAEKTLMDMQVGKQRDGMLVECKGERREVNKRRIVDNKFPYVIKSSTTN